MKLTSEGVVTSTELMQELFGMNKKLIHNLSEKRRYEKIYEYLTTQKGAEELDSKQAGYGDYTVLESEGEVYLIPEDIFDEFDEEWLELLEDEENTETPVQQTQAAFV